MSFLRKNKASKKQKMRCKTLKKHTNNLKNRTHLKTSLISKIIHKKKKSKPNKKRKASLRTLFKQQFER